MLLRSSRVCTRFAPAPNERLAFALIWIGYAWSLTSLGQSSGSVPYTIGRLSVWLIFPGVVYLLLAFPLGRIAPGLDRALFVLIVAVTVEVFLRDGSACTGVSTEDVVGDVYHGLSCERRVLPARATRVPS